MKLDLFLSALVIFLAGSAAAQADLVYVADGGDGTISLTSGPGSTSTFVSGLDAPFGLAMDSAGNLYATCDTARSLQKITPAGQVSTIATFGYSGLCGVAINSSGNFFVADGGGIEEVTPGGTITGFVTGFDSLFGLAFDSFGNLYASDQAVGSIYKITPDGTVTTFASGLNAPDGLAIDGENNLYVANWGSGTVDKITPGGSLSVAASGLGTLQGIAVDSSGDLYVTEYGFLSTTLLEITPQGTDITLASGLSHPNFLVVAVPEPSAPALCILGILLMLLHRRYLSGRRFILRGSDGKYTSHSPAV